MAPIQRRDVLDGQSLGGRHDGRVDRAERKVTVLPNQLCDTQPVRRRYRLCREGSGRQVPEEPDFSLGPKTRLDQVRNLRDDQDRHHQRPRMRRE